MDMSNAPIIIVELIMVGGGALAFGWWQLRDLKKERLKREALNKPEVQNNSVDAGKNADQKS